jgi:hypothetical protein
MMRSILLVALLALAPGAAHGKTRAAARAATSAPVAEREAKADRPRAANTYDDGDAPTPGKTADGKTIKTKTYTFGAMDVEGKLKTPQLLYFLNRVKLELDMSAPDKRSFMKELVKSADDKSL